MDATMRRHPLDERTRAALRDASVLALYEALHDVTGWGLSSVALFVRRGRNEEAMTEMKRIMGTLDAMRRNEVQRAMLHHLSCGASLVWAEVTA